VKNQLIESAAATAKTLSVPAGVVGGKLVLGIDWQPWVYALTALWLVLQASKLLWDWIGKPLYDRRRPKT
jgi:hypothetical protein